ncbi:MAG TPA: aldolase/citrate lyase family protein [Polyangiaceae bacterium]|nr:aldolase/citrate lyase family protein [Polyangiaceae bacterium]
MSLLQDPLPNRFRHDVREKKRLIGCWASLSSPISTEVLGYAGFDWILIDSEHAPNDFQTILTQLLALKDSPSAAVVRPQWAEPVLLKRLLDLGVYNFLMPFIESAEEARAAVAATRYPPRGIRGIAVAQRSNRYGYCPDYFSRIDDNICVLVQIESRKGVEAVHEIAQVDGVDGLFIGPSDLSASLGHFGKPNHPEVQAAMQRVVEAARALGKPVGILATADEDLQRYLGAGMSVVAVGLDVVLLRNASRQLAERYRTP